MKHKVCIFLILLMAQLTWANPINNKAIKVENAVKVSAGSIERYLFHSDFVDDRNVDIWLPDGYTATKKYAVLYMHDGQMLYDSSRAWNAKEWDIDTTIDKLIKKGKIREVIVVGIYNNSNKRHIEYFPQKAIDNIAAPEYQKVMDLMPGGPLADNYLKFIISELKPFIDATYSTKPDQKNTFIAGSSMGGLISMYAICEYPQIFSGAGCLSTHWIGTFDNNKEIPAAFNEYLKLHLPSPRNHKIYFDHGTVGLDANYPEFQKMIDATVKAAGYTDKSLMTLEFPGDDHNETCWAARLHIPLIFLLKK